MKKACLIWLQFFYAQAEEERFHAMKFVRFLLDTGAKPIIPDQPMLRNEFEIAADAVHLRSIRKTVYDSNQQYCLAGDCRK